MRNFNRITMAILLVLSIVFVSHQQSEAQIGPARWYNAGSYLACAGAAQFVAENLSFETSYLTCRTGCTLGCCVTGSCCQDCLTGCFQVYAGALRAIEIPCLMLGVEAGQMVLPDPYSSYFFSSEVQFTNEQAGTPSRPMYYLKYVESTPNGGAFGSAPYNFYMEPGTYSYPLSDAFYPNLNRFTLPATIINNHPENGPVRIVNTQEK